MAAKKAAPYVVVRTFSAGVHVGEMVGREGKEVTLANAKRLWRWRGANTLNEVATKGVLPTSQVSDAAPSVVLTEAIEIITCTAEAEACLRGATWAKQ